ncbi:MAG: acetate kinase [Atopobiaceae bacterium]|nr:acetate kinase [Atopobiaceae bacterium]
MNVLVINAGSSSLKFQLLDVDTREVYAKGNCERIGIDASFIGYESIAAEGKQKMEVPLPDHKTAMGHVIDIINATGKDFIGIGHRVVQGGWYFPESKVVTDESLGWVREVAPLAPLHNYAEADAIEVCRELFPDKGNVVVADTSFHYAIPERAHRYALPRDVVDKLHIRKYGAHGTSHRFIWRASKEFLGDDLHKLVSCHLGSGASLCAITDGKNMDTTMGLTPLDGLIMGTRCGTIDPATVCYLQRVGGYTVDEVDTMMNKQSGLLALSGISSDSRDIEAGAANGDANCQMALEMFAYRTAQLIMEMAQANEGMDTIAFSAGLGENSSLVRQMVADKLAWMGVKIDPEKNAVRSGEVREITGEGSTIRVLVVPTNEELMIALDVKELLG